MTEIRLTVTDRASRLIREAPERAAAAVPDALAIAALEIVNAAMAKLKDEKAWKTGTLARSITVVADGSMRVVVGPQVVYGMYIEFGTGIYAENGQGRKTPWVYKGGDGHFYTTKGIKPRPYMRPAFEQEKENVRKTFSRELVRSLT